MKTVWKLDEWLGIVFYQGKYRFFLEYTAWWILDYATYDPSSLTDNEDNSYYRNGILVVDENPQEFLEAMKSAKISIDNLRRLVNEQHRIVLADEDDYRGDLHLVFLINFDEKLYVSMFADVGYEEYVPKGWKGVFDDPLKYLPEETKSIWKEVEKDDIATKRHNAHLKERNL